MANPGNDPSVFDEPHMRGHAATTVGCWKCGYSRAGLAVGTRCPECGAEEFDPAAPATLLGQDGAERAEQSVWEEPTLSDLLAGETPADAETYARWLDEQQNRTQVTTTWAATVMVAAAAGPWAIVGAFCGAMTGESAGGVLSSRSFLNVLAVIVFGPVMEEVMKIAAATWVVERRPYLFSTASQVAIGCLAGGLAFAAVENVIYLNVYIDQPTPEIWQWRWTVCVMLHCGCSLIAGLGLMRVWRTTMATRLRPDLNLGTRYLVTAIVVHGMYNALAMGLEWVGVG